MGTENKIKTAVELALERTAGMKASREEMQALQERELKERARGLVSKYLNGEKGLQELPRELAETDEAERELFRWAVFEELLSYIELGTECTAAIDALAALGEGGASEEIEKLKALLQTFDDENAREREKRSSALLAELKGRRIWGSGVLPNLRDDERWGNISESLREAYSPKLDKLRAQLLEKKAT